MAVKHIGGGQFMVNGNYVGTDWDYPSAVQSLGYGLKRRGEKCQHRSTDGTIDCQECGKTASQFIQESADILHRLS